MGFTPYASDRDPEEVRETLSRYFDLASDVIGRYGGTVEKFIGDAVMAVWGAPVAREDDAERAVRAGLELVDAVPSLGSSIQARAAILTGEAAVTIGATNQGMVAGDLVNTASRLQSVAPPGAVLAGESTMRAASRAIVFEPIGDQVLKGKASPVAAFRALRVVAEVGGRNRSDTLEAPFVGRQEELRLLKDLFHATGREKRARLVSITGPAGIGKTRLAWEFSKYVDGVVEQVYWHAGRSPAYGEGITFWALGEMVRGRCGLLETEDELTTRIKVSETVARWVPDPEERRWIEPALLALLGLEARVGSEQLFAAWRTFFERIAAHGTVAMVFEDLHYADSGLLDFIDNILEWSRGLPIYIVTLARPELIEKRPDWGAGKRNFISLSLEPISEDAMRALLAGLVPGLPESAVRAIVGRADGIPLYAVETVRMLVSEGRLVETDGVYEPAGDLTSLAVPETLTALIAARLDGLDAADRALVCDAAALGQSFTLAALSAVSGVEPAALEPRLRLLVRRELLTLQADPRSPERGQYAFVQALIREVAYNTLARRDRKARHLAAARFFEGLGSDELAGALAGHYLAAHANASEGAEADALAAQARLALRGAAERASALSAHEQAVAFLEQALTVTTDPAERADLLERAGDLASIGGRYEHGEALLRQALEARRAVGDRLATVRTMTAIARNLTPTFQADRSVELLEPALVEFADLDADPAMVALRAEMARALAFVGDDRRSLAMIDEVLEAAEHMDLIPIVADGLVTKGTVLGKLGRMHEALGVLEAAQRLADARGLSATRLRALINRSNYEMDARGTLDLSRQAVALARRLGRRRQLVIALGNLAEPAVRLGDWDLVIAESDVVLTDELDEEDRVYVLGALVQIGSLRGEPVADEVAQIERVFADRQDPQSVAGMHDLRAVVAFGEGRFAEASAAWAREAELDQLNGPYALPYAARTALWSRDWAAVRADLAALDATGVHRPSLEACRAVIRAGLAAIDGQRTEALALYRDGLRVFQELGLVWDEALTAIDMLTVLGPDEPAAQAAAETAPRDT